MNSIKVASELVRIAKGISATRSATEFQETLNLLDSTLVSVEDMADWAEFDRDAETEVRRAVKHLRDARSALRNAWDHRNQPKPAVVEKVDEPQGRDFNSALNAFVKDCQSKVDSEFTFKKVLSIQKGSRFVKLVSNDNSQRSAWAFVEIATGDVFKVASWNAPAKHARANIYDKNTWKNVGAYGPAYLR
jgi:hypothetical protein